MLHSLGEAAVIVEVTSALAPAAMDLDAVVTVPMAASVLPPFGEHGLLEGDVRRGLGVVGDLGGEVHRHVAAVLGGEARGLDGHAVIADVHAVGDGEGDVAVDAGAGVPAAGRQPVLDLDDDGVLPTELGVAGQVEGERRVAVRMGAELDAVEPDGGVHVHAVEVDGDALAGEHSGRW